jgi:Tol biopolymer transport system component/tRNA A-37 threonylcarbamoyl transferase component Bud32
VAIEAGQQLLHYHLIEKIGEGGMGVVWKAEDTKLHRHIALKILPEAMAVDPERRARFEREARAVAALNHPNIVTLHSVEEADTDTGTVHFITMELVDGPPLTRLLPSSGLDLGRLLEIAIPLADAVSRAHRAGITHRDLKPDNIMVDAEGRLRVLDFGLAKLHEPMGSGGDTQVATVTSDTVQGQVIGTVAYMSPEQAEGKAVDPRSDVFSLGTVLYEMASGARPFRGETLMSTIGSILKDEPSSITGVKPSLPRHMGRILTRCLAKDPDRRYQSALELRNELEQLRAEVDSGMHEIGSPSASVRPRRSWLPALTVIAVVAAITIVAVVQVASRDEAAPAVGTSRPITATSWRDGSPTWSPDGRLVAFERMTAGNLDIYVKPVDGGDAVVRVEGPGDQYNPRWTPDGSHLAYVSSLEPGSPVFLVPADGGRPVRLIDANSPALALAWAVMGDRPWSSDGRTLLVALATEGGAAVHRVDRATGEAEPVTSPPPGALDVAATYSFDGERIAFGRLINGVGALMTMPAAGGEPEVLLQDGFDNRVPVWRPDGRRVLFTSTRGSARNIFEIDVATGETRQLTFETRMVNLVSVSGDDRIVYVPWWHDTFLQMVDVETRERRQITSHTLNNFGGRFSPDGRTIAYSSDRTGNSEIWLHHLDGSPETRFTENEHVDRNPTWSPDGERLVFLSDRDGEALKLYIANADGRTGARRLLDETIDRRGLAQGSPPRWSADGESIAYFALGDVGPELWTVGPDGGEPRRRLAGVWEFDWYRGSRQGIAIRPRGSETELVAVDLETGREEVLFVGALQEIDVAPDGSAVAFLYGRGHFSMGLAVLKLEPPTDPDGLPQAVGEPEYVVRTEGTWHVHGGGWSPDSSSFVYTQDRDYGDIYELIEQ